MMVPGDGRFAPYEKSPPTESDAKPPTDGRIFVLSFQSSTQKHIFWLQSKSQHAQGDPSWFSPRDLKLGDIVNRLLQADEVDVQEEMATVSNNQGGEGGGGGDVNMEDAPPEYQENAGSGQPSAGGNQGGESRGGGANEGA